MTSKKTIWLRYPWAAGLFIGALGIFTVPAWTDEIPPAQQQESGQNGSAETGSSSAVSGQTYQEWMNVRIRGLERGWKEYHLDPTEASLKSIDHWNFLPDYHPGEILDEDETPDTGETDGEETGNPADLRPQGPPPAAPDDGPDEAGDWDLGDGGYFQGTGGIRDTGPETAEEIDYENLPDGVNAVFDTATGRVWIIVNGKSMTPDEYLEQQHRIAAERKSENAAQKPAQDKAGTDNPVQPNRLPHNSRTCDQCEEPGLFEDFQSQVELEKLRAIHEAGEAIKAVSPIPIDNPFFSTPSSPLKTSTVTPPSILTAPDPFGDSAGFDAAGRGSFGPSSGMGTEIHQGASGESADTPSHPAESDSGDHFE